MTRKLEEAVKKQKKTTKRHVPPIYGVLGIPLGGSKIVDVPHRNSYVYVRLRNNQSEVIQAFNNQVSPAYNLPVIVERQGGRYSVVAVDSQRYENNWNSFAPFLPRHGNTHSFDTESGGGGDMVWVYPRQFMPSLIIPSGTLGGPNVYMSSYTLQNANGTWKYTGNTGTPNLTIYNPVSISGSTLVLVYLDAVSGNPGLLVASGTYIPESATGASQLVPYMPTVASPATQIPLSVVRLVTGTAGIGWDNIYDVRQFIHTIPTGTGGGGAGNPGGSATQLQYNNAGVFGGARIDYSYTVGEVTLSTEENPSNDDGEDFRLLGQDGVSNGTGGDLLFRAGGALGDGAGGNVDFRAGDTGGVGAGGDVSFLAGSSSSGTSGNIRFVPGEGGAANLHGKVYFVNPATVTKVELGLSNLMGADKLMAVPNKNGTIALSDGVFTGISGGVALYDSNGLLTYQSDLKWGLIGGNLYLEFGADVVKEANAGRMGYQLFDDYFDIVGAGTVAGQRTVQIYDNLS